jgi:lipopolysaccharide biosynthesis protein
VTTSSDRPESRPATVAFYLPQFHPIPENDAWWGDGFTEWVNVRRAQPLFAGHLQPSSPAGPHGAYDLRNPDVVAWQTELATQNDIDAFCYYHYWFAGKRLLERPLDSYLSTSLDMPFCICWANENWSRRWDGRDREILLSQRYDDSNPDDVFDSFLPYLRDVRYLRSGGHAVLLVHRADHLPDPAGYARVWRQRAEAEGLGELWLVASETSPGLDPRRIGFDAVAEFPPVGDSNLRTALTAPPPDLDRAFRGRLLSYARLRDAYLDRPVPSFPRHRGLVPRWDNTPRRLTRSTVVVGSTPQLYASWLAAARASERSLRGTEGLVFVNAWNEWAEGAYLEPDEEHGSEYLHASRWTYSVTPEASAPYRSSRRPSRAFLHSLALESMSSARDTAYGVRSRLRRRGSVR